MNRRARQLCQMLGIILLVVSVRYWGGLHADGTIGSGGCLIEPQRCAGTTQVYSLVSVLDVHDDGAVDVSVGRRVLRVLGLPEDTSPGDRLSFGGVFHADPVEVHAAWSDRSDGQRGKQGLALLVMGVFALSTPAWLRRESAGWRVLG